eukprot:gene7689-15738_t
MLTLYFILLIVLLVHLASGSPIVVPAPKATEHRRLNAQTVNFIAGGIAGSIASTITTPLEVVKTQLQSSLIGGRKSPIQICNQIMQMDGFLGFFKGIGPTLIGIVPTRAIYFWAYSTSKGLLKGTFGDSPLNHLASAFAAGMTSNTITNPIWMVKTRYQLFADAASGQKVYTNYLEVIKSIWREEGPPGFFKGLSASYVGCIEGAVQWLVYERIKTSVLFNKVADNGNGNGKTGSGAPSLPPAVNYFLAAALSKFIAVCATYPHEVVRTRLREQASNGAFKYTNFLSALQTIAKEEGTRGLYGGMSMHLLRSVPNAAIMFATFELTTRWMNQQIGEPVPPVAVPKPAPAVPSPATPSLSRRDIPRAWPAR